MDHQRKHPAISPLGDVTGEIDAMFSEDLCLMQQAVAGVLDRLDSAHKQKSTRRKQAVYNLQLNAITSVGGAVELWRRGFVLQVGVLLRNALEATATAAVVNASHDEWKAYDRGVFKSSASIGKVKTLWPLFAPYIGKANGVLSNQFSHMGKLYRSWQKVTPGKLEQSEIKDLKASVIAIKAILILLELESEATSFHVCSDRRYWVLKRAGVLSLQPTEVGRQWLQRFIGEDDKYWSD